MQRPTGVTVLAVLDFIGAAFWLLMAVGGFLGATFLGAIISQAAARSGGGTIGAGLGAAIGVVIGIFGLIFGGLAVLMGWGMWSLKEWARILQIVFAAIGACFQALGILVALSHFRILGMMWNMAWLAINAFIIYYLVQPQVKAAFAAGPALGYAPPAPPTPPVAGA
ncbi:MAG TPA: hypothetical protein VFU86_21580 [Terriglobales bacterium]|nr:hypothetical protein [Terriglobales bacterium]